MSRRFSIRNFRGYVSCLTILCLASVAGRASGADEIPAPDAKAKAEIAALIIQLGEELFDRREEAVTKLLTYGLPALKQIEEGTKNADPEIRYRCGVVRVALKEIDLDRRLKAFAADVKGEKDHGLPAWNRFAELHGSGAESRQLFVDIFTAEPTVLKGLQTDPKKTNDVVSSRVFQLQQSLQTQQQISLGSVTALLFAAGEKDVTLTVQNQQMIFNFCHQPSVREAIMGGPKKDVVRSVLGKYIVRSEGWAAHQGLNLALQYELKEGLEVARKMVKSKGGGQPHLMQLALLATAKLGNTEDIADMEPLLEDKTVIFASQINNQNIQCQVRDFALVSMTHLLSKDKERVKATPLESGDLKAFGFSRLEANPFQLYAPHTVGFVNEDDRLKVFAKWNDTKIALQKKSLILPGEAFLVSGRSAFILLPPEDKRQKLQPWILYAPTLPGLPDAHEKWMHEQFLAAGIAVAGIDIGESYGSPTGRQLFTVFHKELTEKRGFAPKPCLLGRSRGGLWTASWACEHPELVAGLAGIYPVFDIRTYPGLEKAAPAYGLTTEELQAKLVEHNPIERIGALAKAKIPVLFIHGDDDKVVPLKENSAEFVARYKSAGAESAATLIVAKGQGHNYWEGFFHCQDLVDFAIARAREGAKQ